MGQADQGVKPCINRIGSKEKLQRIIRSVFPPQYDRFSEHLGGCGAILLGGPRKAGVLEVYNDFDSNLFNFFYCLRERPLSLLDELGFLPLHSEEEFLLLKRFLRREIDLPDFTASETAVVERYFTGQRMEELQAVLAGRAELGDVRRAAAFYQVNRSSYNGKMDAFGVRKVMFRSFIRSILLVAERLEGVVITNRDCVDSIRLNDKSGTLHYCDPPYYDAEGMYDVTFTTGDHARLHDALTGCEGYVVVSYNYCDPICELFSDFYILKFDRHNEMARRKGAIYEEVIITNYDPRPMIDANQSQISMFGPPDLEQEDATLMLIHTPDHPTKWEKENL